MVANTPFEGFSAGDIAIADSENDGDEDVLISGQLENGGAISNLYLNDGTGTFSLLSGTPFPGTFLGETAFADFDNDGDLDVFIVGTGLGGILSNSIIANVYENQGLNNFVLADELIGAYLSSCAIGDIDGDNDLDLVVGGTSVGSPTRATRMYVNVALLPVELLDFTGAIQNEAVYLQWQTAQELNNAGFEIEKSMDNRTWESIDYVEGQGTDFDLNEYVSKDENPVVGTNYYRLKQLDFDGQFEYSKVIAVDFKTTSTNVTIFPNPATDFLIIKNLSDSEELLEVSIFNVMGQPMTIDYSNQQIDVARLPKGFYVLKMETSEGYFLMKFEKR